MKIYTITDFNVPFEVVTVSYAIQGLSKYINNCSVKVYSFDDLKKRKIDVDSDNDVLLIFEIGYPQHTNLTTKDLRKWFPNARFITLSCDTFYYMYNNLPLQLPDQREEIELTLELIPQCQEWLEQKGIKCDSWTWTLSDRLLHELEQLTTSEVDFNRKTNDFIGVYHPCTLENVGSYRYNMVKYLRDNGFTFSQGGGSGHNDKNLNRTYQTYLNSWFTLGTTSHNNPLLSDKGGMKGFRDWIGPILNCLLIYDNHPNVQKLFPINIIPNYTYGDFEGILKIAKEYQADPIKYITLLEKQKKWAKDNTIDKQLVTTLLKYNFVKQNEIKVYIAP